MAILTAFILGLLTILDPCTLITSITAIGYIDREMANRKRVLICGICFVLGKIVTYMLLAIPFLIGGETHRIQSLLGSYGETLMGIFLFLCGIVLLVAGHHHHEHDHGMSRWLKTVDETSYPFWSIMLGIFFAICFCPHRLIYFLTMIDMTITLGGLWNWVMPLIFGLGTGLPILIFAWGIPYGILSKEGLQQQMMRYEKIIRITCAGVFVAAGAYTIIESLHHIL